MLPVLCSDASTWGFGWGSQPLCLATSEIRSTEYRVLVSLVRTEYLVLSAQTSLVVVVDTAKPVAGDCTLRSSASSGARNDFAGWLHRSTRLPLPCMDGPTRGPRAAPAHCWLPQAAPTLIPHHSPFASLHGMSPYYPSKAGRSWTGRALDPFPLTAVYLAELAPGQRGSQGRLNSSPDLKWSSSLLLRNPPPSESNYADPPNSS